MAEVGLRNLFLGVVGGDGGGEMWVILEGGIQVF